ncbi:MAG: hypothetical protein ACEPOW_13950 [Bacteroidales bacterium]
MLAKITLTHLIEENVTKKLTLNAYEDLVEVFDKITFEEDEVAPANVDTDFKYIIHDGLPWEAKIKIIKTDRHE